MLTEINNVRIFDGKELTSTKTIVIDDRKILTKKTEGDTIDNVIDATGCTLLPGLIDGHVHIEGKRDIEASVRWGVTTMADMCPYSKRVADKLRNVSGLTDIITSYAPAMYPVRNCTW